MTSRKNIIGFIGGGILLGIVFISVSDLLTNDLVGKAAEMPATTFAQKPVFVGEQELASSDDTLAQPFGLAIFHENLLVSYVGANRIEEYSPDFSAHREFNPSPEPDASFTGLLVYRDRLYTTNYRTGELYVLNYQDGSFVTAFGTFPDGRTRMKLFGIAQAGDEVYATDSRTNTILAISTTTIPGIKEEGELITTFPSPKQENFQLSFPSFAATTPDGRLLVSDVGNKEVKVFTCSGRPIQRFETSERTRLHAPMGIAMDNVPSPQSIAAADSIFDPSGMLYQGRVHVVDSSPGRVHVYDASGRYVLTYGEELERPNGIAIDTNRRLIFIADAEKRAVLLYKY
jgi:sugar lactone lactonase YvrE